MPAQNKQINKYGRTQALKRSKQKKVLALVCVSVVVIVVVVAALVVFNSPQQSADRVFTDGHQTITLYDDGTFVAALAHDMRGGTYTQNTVNGVVTVTFLSDEVSVTSSIVDDVLSIPKEWQDAHGHGTQLPLT
ncbi:hypothetical protein [Candidatus Bathycorpusculum sp.]|jgi:predicted aspartyl protease|uniref:hypothetical protein n=1 Tax=Candidatus Bathycorpusculum sp. TaxID=2994959 RepID=UPI002824AA29|nr:hypothetical protein [Candidatus Termitimicrobium sp.]MCL2686498.1 hypothetical protein [Candidatus Termitimicrobium sp.]